MKALVILLAVAALMSDTDGRHINAHGGGMMELDGVFYWYGESRGDEAPGVACYRSRDLREWENLGTVLAVSDSAGHLLERGCIIERPKVVRCPSTGKFVMWFHHELKGRGYGSAHAAVAVADTPTGPFELLHSGRVNPGHLPLGGDTLAPAAGADTLRWWTDEWRRAVADGLFTLRDLEGGQMARDQTVFVDIDGRAWHVYSSEENLTLQIAELDSTYTRHTGRYVRVAPGGHNEAPVLLRHGGRYWMITSGCTGWAPNSARLLRADSITGPWTLLPNPCVGAGAETTFGSQGCHVFEHPRGEYIFMADKWNPQDLRNSGHLWIRLTFAPDGTPQLCLP